MKTNKTNWIEEKMKEFDIKQRLFLHGKYHSTHFNKWFMETLKEQEERVMEKAEEKVRKWYVYPKPKDKRERGLNIVNTAYNQGRQDVLESLKTIK